MSAEPNYEPMLHTAIVALVSIDIALGIEGERGSNVVMAALQAIDRLKAELADARQSLTECQGHFEGADAMAHHYRLAATKATEDAILLQNEIDHLRAELADAKRARMGGS